MFWASPSKLAARKPRLFMLDISLHHLGVYPALFLLYFCILHDGSCCSVLGGGNLHLH